MTTDKDQTPFEKPGSAPTKPSGGRSRLAVGVIAGLFFVVLVILGVVLYMSASATGGGGNGQTTGTVLLLLFPLLG
ncbi:hypothetical protein [Actinomycetospora atypica]|uniref:Uncharacterized protein n=1 Tax=Actinomycetospora atypica TaxID=1290095 RepID=A0ABV9YJV7_9PSEU